MKWIITRDLLCDMGDQSRVGKGNVASKDEIPEPHIEFRLLDDDEDIYYYGVANKQEFDDADGEHAFAPLDWAMNDAGATSMEYREGDGPWLPL